MLIAIGIGFYDSVAETEALRCDLQERMGAGFMSHLPNFIVVGAAKSGTTSLYHYLRAHPDVYLSADRKELRYFSEMSGGYQGPGDDLLDPTIARSISDYGRYFDAVSGESAVGDVSPDYLYYHQVAAPKIERELGDVKIVIILRNPVDRAYSQYMHFVRDGRERLSFDQALSSLAQRKAENWEWAWQYLDVGLYYEQVRTFRELFSDVQVLYYDDLKRDAASVLHALYGFIGVDADFIPNTLQQKFNVSSVPRARFLDDFLAQDGQAKDILKRLMPPRLRTRLRHYLISFNRKRTTMTSGERDRLRSFYQEDIEQLSSYLGRDLSHWLAS